MLDISPILLISSSIIFLLVLARLNSCLYKPLFKHMEDRTKSIAKDLANAKNTSSNIDSILIDAKNIIAKAKGEASTIRDNAIAQAKELADEKLNLAKSNLDAKYSDFVNELKKEKESLKQSLSANMPVFKESLKLKISSI